MGSATLGLAPPTLVLRLRKGFSRLWPALRQLVLLGTAIVLLYPLAWMIGSSLKPSSEILTETGLFPREIQLENYQLGWLTLPGVTFGSFMVNSAIVAGLAVVGNVVSCSLAAFAFARLEFPLKRVLFPLMLATLMLPIHVRAVPEYILFQKLGWINTFLPLVAPKFLAVDAFFIYLTVQFIRSLPSDFEDAARVDGCGNLGVFRHVIVPLCRPALITTAILTMIWTYEDFFNQLIYLTDPDKFTVPVGLSLFISATEGSAWGPLFAMGVLSLIPILLIFTLAQRYLVEGIAAGGVKG